MIARLIRNPYPLRYVLYKAFQKRAKSYTREHYHYCIKTAAETAAALGVDTISILEFGVAGGNGLVEIETICEALARSQKVSFEIYGFDTGAGLPPPEDYRDLPYQWQEGFFAMDVDALRKRLRRAKLILGNVRETVPAFLETGGHAPIGAIMFDLDYYSSTIDAFRILKTERYEGMLPRIQCYFDDIEGIPSCGVGLAISEFNAANADRKVETPMSLKHKRESRDRGWKVFEFHQFAHPRYSQPIVRDRQLPLSQG